MVLKISYFSPRALEEQTGDRQTEWVNKTSKARWKTGTKEQKTGRADSQELPVVELNEI